MTCKTWSLLSLPFALSIGSSRMWSACSAPSFASSSEVSFPRISTASCARQRGNRSCPPWPASKRLSCSSYVSQQALWLSNCETPFVSIPVTRHRQGPCLYNREGLTIISSASVGSCCILLMACTHKCLVCVRHQAPEKCKICPVNAACGCSDATQLASLKMSHDGRGPAHCEGASFLLHHILLPGWMGMGYRATSNDLQAAL